MSAKVVIIVSRDTWRAGLYASRLIGDVVYWPEARLHPSRHFGVVAPRVKRALQTGEPLVVATHSDTIITAIGELVEIGKIPQDAVEVRMVEGDAVRTFTYDSKGYLGPNWSIGWFTADDAIDDWEVA